MSSLATLTKWRSYSELQHNTLSHSFALLRYGTELSHREYSDVLPHLNMSLQFVSSLDGDGVESYSGGKIKAFIRFTLWLL